MVAGVTGAIVFLIGLKLFPVQSNQPPAPPPAAPVAPPAAQQPPLPPAPAEAGAAAAAADASSVATKAADAGAASAAAADGGKSAARDKAATAEPEPKDEKKPASDEAEASDDAEHKSPAEKQRQADKDLAREAWRRNRPDVSVVGNKTAVMVPIRGSIKGADFKIGPKRRAVVVTLPRAVSMVTMRVYNLKHPQFKKVWIDQDEANAQPQDGTKLRFILSQTLDPQVEITDDFVRVTVRRPEPGNDSSGEREHGDARPEKHGDARPEKQRGESADDSAATEKEKD